MTVKILTSARIPQEVPETVWTEILEQMSGWSFFQTPRWSEILCSIIPGAQARHRYLTFSDGTTAALPLIFISQKLGIGKLSSLVWGTYGGLLSVQPLNLDHIQSAALQVLSLREPVCDLTFNPIVDAFSCKESTAKYISIARTTHILHLQPDFNDLWANHFSPRNRTAIRRAQDADISIGWSNQAPTVAAMKNLYQQACLRWQGVETLPEVFFDVLENLPGDEVRIWFGIQKKHVICADVIFYGKGEVQYFAGAMDANYSRLNGSKLLMAEIIRDACERGFTIFNFGASGGQAGVEQFKELFGGEKTSYTTLRFSHPLFNFARAIIKA